jgi:cytosine/adenosine deaminase-related metal-dependent hydrolase
LLGSITPGKRADIAQIDTRRLGMSSNIDPLATVVQSTTPADVNTVIADGRFLKLDGKLLRGDFALLSQQADRALESL